MDNSNYPEASFTGHRHVLVSSQIQISHEIPCREVFQLARFLGQYVGCGDVRTSIMTEAETKNIEDDEYTLFKVTLYYTVKISYISPQVLAVIYFFCLTRPCSQSNTGSGPRQGRW